MIVRDGLTPPADVLRCLASVAPALDEVVLVDTGSTDGTGDAVQDFCAANDLPLALIREPWQDDFAHHRNTALEATRGRWVLWLDDDEEVPVGTLVWLARQKQRIVDHAMQNFSTKKADGTEVSGRRDAAVLAYVMLTAGPGIEMNLSNVRLFPKREDVRWRFRLHEAIAPACYDAGLTITNTGRTIWHHGYADGAKVARSKVRNDRLTEIATRNGEVIGGSAGCVLPAPIHISVEARA